MQYFANLNYPIVDIKNDVYSPGTSSGWRKEAAEL